MSTGTDPFFETSRLIVRGISYDDLDAFATLCADPVAMQYMGDGKPLDRQTVQHWIDVCHRKYRERGYGTSAVVEKASGEFIGFCGVVRAPDNDFDEVIYAFAQQHWGKGYASEVAAAMLDYVFRISNLDEIYATIHSANKASQRVMAKVGMHYLKTQIEEDGHEVVFYIVQRQNAS
jgi:[ribosomal protein S5]-alanine N-acetyltransferase